MIFVGIFPHCVARPTLACRPHKRPHAFKTATSIYCNEYSYVKKQRVNSKPEPQKSVKTWKLLRLVNYSIWRWNDKTRPQHSLASNMQLPPRKSVLAHTSCKHHSHLSSTGAGWCQWQNWGWVYMPERSLNPKHNGIASWPLNRSEQCMELTCVQASVLLEVGQLFERPFTVTAGVPAFLIFFRRLLTYQEREENSCQSKFCGRAFA